MKMRNESDFESMKFVGNNKKKSANTGKDTARDEKDNNQGEKIARDMRLSKVSPRGTQKRRARTSRKSK